MSQTKRAYVRIPFWMLAQPAALFLEGPTDNARVTGHLASPDSIAACRGSSLLSAVLSRSQGSMLELVIRGTCRSASNGQPTEPCTAVNSSSHDRTIQDLICLRRRILYRRGRARVQ